MRPVSEGYCLYESLGNGVLDLADVALMNDTIDVVAENRARAAARVARK